MATFRLTAPFVSSLPLPEPTIEQSKPLYSLYKMNGRSWLRVSEASYYLNTAKFVFHDRILELATSGVKVDIRPIELELLEAR